MKRLLIIIMVGILMGLTLSSSVVAQDDDDHYIRTDWKALGTQLSTDGSRVAFVSYWIDDVSEVMVLDTATGETLFVGEHPFMLGSQVIEEWWQAGLQFSPDESFILSWPGNNYAHIWNAETGERIHFIEVLGESIRSGMWHPDGDQILLITKSAIHLVDVTSGTETNFAVMGEDIASASYSHDGMHIMIALTAGQIEILDLDLVSISDMSGETDIRGAAWSPDDTQILTWASNGSVNVWDVESGSLAYTLSHDKAIRIASWSPDGQYFLVVDEENDGGASEEYFGRIWVYAGATGELIHQVRVEGIGYGGAVWSPDSQYFAAWTYNINYEALAHIYNLTETEPLHSANLNSINGVIWQSDMSALVLWSEVNSIFLFEPLDGVLPN